ncbi:IDEAL domain-containing protein [Sutcliffiella horikoshii]|uniref:IDEAL domain-containing protein n=1 Tax=Sutcliffiella horikoshii TaxID=79883 RepID=UPI00203BCB71|nr:IDEAL domain-containing protein [Sutcliffiella horikoshii]MCM3620487.1 IDEAL domain-containing protein [Sutcliffiella horikoshii]
MSSGESLFLEQQQHKVGDWVHITRISNGFNPRAYGSQGFVMAIDKEDEAAEVLFLKHGSGKDIRQLIWIHLEDLSEMNSSLEGEDIQTLIDMALATNDKEWFQELTEKLQKELIGW